MDNNSNSGRAGIITVITSPLGFFALCLLTVEIFLGITLIYSNLSPDNKFWGMIIGATLFVFVVVIVALLVWKFPKNLTFGEASWLKNQEMERVWNTKENPTTKKEVDQELPVSKNESQKK